MSTTRDGDGALRRTAGAPASTGGQFAAETAPAAAATLAAAAPAPSIAELAQQAETREAFADRLAGLRRLLPERIIHADVPTDPGDWRRIAVADEDGESSLLSDLYSGSELDDVQYELTRTAEAAQAAGQGSYDSTFLDISGLQEADNRAVAQRATQELAAASFERLAAQAPEAAFELAHVHLEQLQHEDFPQLQSEAAADGRHRFVDAQGRPVRVARIDTGSATAKPALINPDERAMTFHPSDDQEFDGPSFFVNHETGQPVQLPDGWEVDYL